MTTNRTPVYWLRQRGGEIDTVRLNADEAEMIAQRPGVKGDHLQPTGLVWREKDPDATGGWAYFTLTPVFEERRPARGRHGEYLCPSPCCSGATVEAQAAREVYGCDAGRHCTAVTPRQRIAYDQQITAALAAPNTATETR